MSNRTGRIPVASKVHLNAEDYFAKDRKKREQRKAAKKTRRNQTKRPPRQKDWTDMAYDDAENWDVSLSYERLMPRDEQERRQEIATKTREVFREPEEAVSLDSTGKLGQVTEVSMGLSRVRIGKRMVLCYLRGSLLSEDSGYSNVVAVGDRVIIGEDVPDKGVIERVLPRRNRLARPDPSGDHRLQVIAANVDQLLIVSAWRQPNLWLELIDRYLIAAERNDIKPVIAVNKLDLADSLDEVEAAIQPYREIGYRVVLTSAERGDGLEELRSLLYDKVTVLAGLSGVGKSSLLTAIQPGFELRTGAVNTDKGQGRHTTTQATMLPFGDAGYVIDTPGIREFGLSGLRRSELVGYFPEINALSAHCRFTDCTHIDEPDCAVLAALDAGEVSDSRYKSYCLIRDTLSE